MVQTIFSCYYFLFDRLRFTLLPIENSGNSFKVHLTHDHPAHPDLVPHKGKVITFDCASSIQPISHLFIYKLLGDLVVCCPVCKKFSERKGFANHFAAAHKNIDKIEVNTILPFVSCNVNHERNFPKTIKGVYDHVNSYHFDLLKLEPIL